MFWEIYLDICLKTRKREKLCQRKSFAIDFFKLSDGEILRAEFEGYLQW